MPSEPVTVETFSTEVEAELAKSELEAAGVEAFVLSDDAGGTHPELQFTRGVRVMVRKEDETRARELLAGIGDQAPPSESA